MRIIDQNHCFWQKINNCTKLYYVKHQFFLKNLFFIYFFGSQRFWVPQNFFKIRHLDLEQLNKIHRNKF